MHSAEEEISKKHQKDVSPDKALCNYTFAAARWIRCRRSTRVVKPLACKKALFRQVTYLSMSYPPLGYAWVMRWAHDRLLCYFQDAANGRKQGAILRSLAYTYQPLRPWKPWLFVCPRFSGERLFNKKRKRGWEQSQAHWDPLWFGFVPFWRPCTKNAKLLNCCWSTHHGHTWFWAPTIATLWQWQDIASKKRVFQHVNRLWTLCPGKSDELKSSPQVVDRDAFLSRIRDVKDHFPQSLSRLFENRFKHF